MASDADIFSSASSGIINTAANFTADGSRNINLTNNIDTQGSFSVNLWAKDWDDNAGENDFIGKYSAGNNGDWIIIRGSIRIAFGIYDDVGGYKQAITAGLPGDNSWTMFTGVYNQTHLVLYMNGTEQGRTAFSGSLDSSDSSTFIGNAGTGRAADGYIDEVGIWNRALNSTEVAELYNSGDGLPYPFE